MTSKKDDTDFTILGAGMAGLSLADALVERGRSVCVIDTSGIAAGASGTPIGMVNPATGKRAKLIWKARECYRSITQSLKSASAFTDKPFYVNNGVLRPAQSTEMAEKMYKKFTETDWPEGWVEWMNEEQIESFHPGIHCVGGGIWLPVAMTIEFPRYLQALSSKIAASKGTVKIRPEYTVNKQSNKWVLDTDRGEKVLSDQIVYATGEEVAEHPYWKTLPLQKLKGQVALYRIAGGLDFDHSVASRGYMAHINRRELLVGSTYERNFEHVNPDTEGERTLREKLKNTIPYLDSSVILSKQWAGLRITTPDHMPIVGDHPELNGIHVYTGLGSKGLLYGRFIAEHYASHLVDGTPLFPEVSLKRYNDEFESYAL